MTVLDQFNNAKTFEIMLFWEKCWTTRRKYKDIEARAAIARAYKWQINLSTLISYLHDVMSLLNSNWSRLIDAHAYSIHQSSMYMCRRLSTFKYWFFDPSSRFTNENQSIIGDRQNTLEYLIAVLARTFFSPWFSLTHALIGYLTIFEMILWQENFFPFWKIENFLTRNISDSLLT